MVSSHIMDMILVLQGVGPILVGGYGFKNKIMSHHFREAKCLQDCTPGI